MTEAELRRLVRPLEWHGEPDWCFADTPVGHYTVSKQVNFDHYRVESHGRDRMQNWDATTAEQAKAAAQADYADRILSALLLDALSALEAENARLREGEAWQPIETAPKNQRVQVAWPQSPYDDLPWAIQIARQGRDGRWRSTLNGTDLPEKPTHWRPILAPPRTAGADHE